MDHTDYLVVIFGYVLVAVISFCAGWIWKTVRTKRGVKEIDGFALYRLMIIKREGSATEALKHKEEQNERTDQDRVEQQSALLDNHDQIPFRYFTRRFITLGVSCHGFRVAFRGGDVLRFVICLGSYCKQEGYDYDCQQEANC